MLMQIVYPPSVLLYDAPRQLFVEDPVSKVKRS
jgi:hypothetical protein